MIETATEVLGAFAQSDVDAIERLCAPDVLVWGTDKGESWQGRQLLVDAFRGVFDLGVRVARRAGGARRLGRGRGGVRARRRHARSGAGDDGVPRRLARARALLGGGALVTAFRLG